MTLPKSLLDLTPTPLSKERGKKEVEYVLTTLKYHALKSPLLWRGFR